ncbi:helix-hairpin-helix domain-containing protein [Desulfovibrio sp. UIB00]|uniref:helix-hairpin-helix domain-containing protein n=1 Tax=Desulfovibrio sp. UIB00 TaxID=2804314 RepID=UPI001F0E446C
MNKKADARTLNALRSVGPATIEDLRLLGVADISALAGCDPQALYDELCRIKGRKIDICCLDVFNCAVAQAKNPELSDEQRNWFWWSRQRKAATSPRIADKASA